MMPQKPRLEPIEQENWNAEQRELLGKQSMRGNVPNIFKTLIHHEKLTKRWLVFASHILSKSTLSARDREIAILRTGWLARSNYEWGQHVLIGQDAGLSIDEIEHIKEGSKGGSWTDHERHILTACEELHENVVLTEQTWTGLAETLDNQQMLDLIFTVGQYRMLAGALNSIGVPLDEDIKHLVD